MNRLVDSSYDGRKESFTYDKVGNRLTKTTNDITEKYVYNVKNQLKEIYQEKGNSTHIRSLSKFDLAKCKIWSLTYDKQGNTISEETTNGNNLFEYNTLNQQVKAITKDGNTLVNRYDSEGLRYEIEENAKRILNQMENNTPGAHFLEKHGAQTTLQAQLNRVQNGVNPTTQVVERYTRGRRRGQIKLPSAATRFLNNRDELNMINRAKQILKNTGDMAKAQKQITFTYPIGEGYNKQGLQYGKAYSGRVFFDRNHHQPITAFPKWGE